VLRTVLAAASSASLKKRFVKAEPSRSLCHSQIAHYRKGRILVGRMLPKAGILRQYIYSFMMVGGINRSVKIELKGAQ